VETFIISVMNKKLTLRLIQNLEPKDRDYVTWDGEIPGHGLKVTPTGRKMFILKYRNASGKQRKPTLGSFGKITLDEARRIARRYHADLAQGIDPLDERQKKKQSLTLNEFVEGYFQQATKKQSTLKIETNNYDNYIRKTLGKNMLDKLSRSHIQVWFSKLSKTPSAANRTISMLSAIFNEAERQELRSEHSNPCRLVKRYPNKMRDRKLSDDELDRFTTALMKADQEKLLHPSIVPVIKYLMLTGARKSEALGLKWEWVDFENGFVDLPDSKTGERRVPLSPDAINLLKSVTRLHGNPYVFYGGKEGDHYHNLKKPFHKLLEMAEIKDFRIHDLRHTYASIAAEEGIALGVIAKILGHAKTSTTERYTHYDDKVAAEAAIQIGEVLSPKLKIFDNDYQGSLH